MDTVFHLTIVENCTNVERNTTACWYNFLRRFWFKVYLPEFIFLNVEFSLSECRSKFHFIIILTVIIAAPTISPII